MAVIWLESFDLYGLDETALAQRGYTVSGISVARLQLVSSPVRTGSNSLQIGANSNEDTYIRRSLDTPVDVLGMGAAWYSNNSIGTSYTNTGFGFGVGSGNFTYKVTPNVDRGVTLWQGATALGNSATNILPAFTWNWVEVKAINNTAGGGASTGSFEVRVNGVTVLTVTGLNITAQFERVLLGDWIGNVVTNNQTTIFFDDWVIWDNSGADNNDFLGDRRIITLFPNADTIDADWLPSTGSEGFAMIDEAPPVDTDFITANNPGDISEFDKQPIPLDVNTVAAVCPVARAFKDSAGTSTFRVGINSAGNVINSSEFIPNTTVSYFGQIFELDPNGNIPWTKTAVDNATIRLTRET